MKVNPVADVSRKIFVISTFIAAGVPAFFFASKGLWSWVFLNITWGLLLILGRRFEWRWTGSLGLFFFAVAAARCSFLKVQPEWLLLSVVAGLSLRDLHAFLGRLNRAEKVERSLDLERRHIKRLMITSGLGLLLGLITLKVDMNVRFGWMLLMAIALILGLSRLMERIGREGD